MSQRFSMIFLLALLLNISPIAMAQTKSMPLINQPLIPDAVAAQIRPQSAAPAPVFTTLFNFGEPDGIDPEGELVQGTDGNFYGTTYAGGTNTTSCYSESCGTVFRITPEGALTTIYSFCSQPNCTDGFYPNAGLVLGTDGKFYGTTTYGGISSPCERGCGTVFSITPTGTLTTLYKFCSQSNCTDGDNPQAGLVQGTDGHFYGTTFYGGANDTCPVAYGCGTVFTITRSGTLTTLYSLCSKVTNAICTDGEFPIAGLVQGNNGRLFGTTSSGGNTANAGTIFSITPEGTLTTIYTFCTQSDEYCLDGFDPEAALVEGSDGNLYGSAASGGPYCHDARDDYGGCGTVFKIEPSGRAFTMLGAFGYMDGKIPTGALVQGTDGKLYGTASAGGDGTCESGCGTVFSIARPGKLTTLHYFEGYPTDGYSPVAGLVQGTDGAFYGTAKSGGAHDYGMLFSLSVGLGPFVRTNPLMGRVREPVMILGTNLTGATSVMFNGIAATFAVVSGTEITTAVPSGATNGTVQVVTPGGTLSSNVPFRVLP